MAVGATRWQVAEAVHRKAWILLTVGVTLGAPLTLALTLLIRSHLRRGRCCRDPRDSSRRSRS
jgi:hypothetical protein